MEKVRPWCGQPSDRGRLKNRTEHPSMTVSDQFFDSVNWVMGSHLACKKCVPFVPSGFLLE